MHEVSLICHPDAPCVAVRHLGVCLTMAAARLQVSYRLSADLTALRIPEPGRGVRADGLWRHTCFELFLMEEGEERYREFNFAPSSQWAAYGFDAYRRQGTDLVQCAQPIILVERIPGELRMKVDLCMQAPRHPVRAGVSAVIEDSAGALSYWALKHPEGKPDFHHRDGFALNLEVSAP